MPLSSKSGILNMVNNGGNIKTNDRIYWFCLFLYSNFKKFILTLCTDCEKYISINTYLTRVVVRTAHYGSYVMYDHMYM